MRSRPISSLAVIALLAVGSVGCEQMSSAWFPQMKKQPAIQAFESTEVNQVQGDATVRANNSGFMPPEGAVAINAERHLTAAEGETLLNPIPEWERAAHFANGKKQYETFCSPCHGVKGDAQGPIAPVIQGVMPLIGLVRAYTDGHIYTTIRLGGLGGFGRMPSYKRIQSEDRWDIVTYIRYLDAKAMAETEALAKGGQL